MSDISIHVEGLGKHYRIGKRLERYKTLRDTLVHTMVNPLQRVRSLLRGQASEAAEHSATIWALKDISFEIKKGEVVGIIGRNGAGKSTLLKILSRITEASCGFAEIHGRIGSLLEVGTGFHPELTGRENIFLNGAILGMRKAEIESKLDTIIDFSEVEKFIDTPVKHFSSGMHLRLAFAVAAHLEPEILLVDEVLAVGDARFQKKCLNKMQSVGREGRTVLFVSHNMPTITRLCERTILLQEGRILGDGPSPGVVSTYLNAGLGTVAVREWPDMSKAPGNEVARLRAVRVRTEDGRVTEVVDIRQRIGIDMEYEVFKSGYLLMPNYHFLNENGLHVFSAHDVDPSWRGRPRPVGRYKSTAWVPGNFLSEGTIYVTFELTSLEPVVDLFHEREAVAFQVIDSLNDNSSRGDWKGKMGGVVRPLLEWATEFISSETISARSVLLSLVMLPPSVLGFC